ncbi:MAG TPA: hypothetical protein VKT29_03000 [Terriglobales bacterium]|nr:hypothetical protein [Terriglobales bacterium]
MSVSIAPAHPGWKLCLWFVFLLLLLFLLLGTIVGGIAFIRWRGVW